MAYEVTIGIPVYNVEKYIRLTMDSALAQTFESIEFLVLDDCGTDASISIVREYQQTHPRGKDIRIIRQPHNMGIGIGRNRIVSEAKGKYLYFLDADDSISANSIELLYSSVVHYNADIACGSYCRVEEFGDSVNKQNWQFPSMCFLREDEFACYAYQKYDLFPANVWNFLIKVEIFRKNNIVFPDTNYWEDFSVTMDLPTYIERAVLLPDITYYYYCRYGSLSNFQHRSFISKNEIQKTIEMMGDIKRNSDRIKKKSYFPGRMYKVMMSHFYIVCTIVSKRTVISPSFSNREIRDVMHSPLTFNETLNLKGWRLKNLFLYFLGVLPPFISVGIIKMYILCKSFSNYENSKK